MDIEKNYDTYMQYLKTYIKRDGIEDLIKFIESSDAKQAPASTKYHLAVPGGLIKHSLNVFYRLVGLTRYLYPPQKVLNKDGTETLVPTCPYSKETLALVALLHDIDKVNKYAEYYRNVQNPETGMWEKVKSYKTISFEDGAFVFGTHSENSLYKIKQFFKLSYEEELAILNHMGGLDYTERDVQRNVYDAFRKSNLAFMLHTADMMASILDESTVAGADNE